jgi:hypothetical protein
MNLETLTKCPRVIKKRGTSATVKGDICDLKADTKNAESAPASESVGEPLEPLVNRYSGQPVDNFPKPSKTDIGALKSYLASLEGLAQKDATTHEEINRVNEEIKQLIISAGTSGQMQL